MQLIALAQAHSVLGLTNFFHSVKASFTIGADFDVPDWMIVEWVS